MVNSIEDMKKAPPIVQEGTEEGAVLREIAPEVSVEMLGSKKLFAILADMSAALRLTSDGVAIAAPQIGVSLRIFVVRGYIMAGMHRKDEGADDIPDVAFINPIFLEASEEQKMHEGEGCLSCRGYSVHIERPAQIKVRAQDEHGEWREVDSVDNIHTDFLAEIFDHETDHLNGTLCIDHAQRVFKKIDGVWHLRGADGSWIAPKPKDETKEA